MSSDADYASFLDKANAPPGGASTSSTGNRDSHKGAGFTTKSVDKDVDIPPSIKEVAGSEIYVSDSDEEFQAVGLKWDGEGEDIDEDDFAKLTDNKTSSVSKISAKDFDPRGQYKKVLTAVEKASKGSISIFRIDGPGTRAEYWVVGLEKDGGKIVGLKAAAVES